MYRRLVSGMRVGCVAVVILLWTAVLVTAETSQSETPCRMKGGDEPKMSSKAASESTDVWMESDSIVATQPAYQRLGQVIGKPVLGSRGEKLGRIEDVVLDSRGDSISYAALSSGGFLGLRTKLFAVPWSEFCRHPEKDAYVLNVRKAYLDSVPDSAADYQIRTPYWAEYAGTSVFSEEHQAGTSDSTAFAGAAGFPKNRWPDRADEDWVEKISTLYREGHYMSGPSYRESPSRQTGMMAADKRLPVDSRRVTQLIGMSAKDLQGHTLGRLDDIVVDTTSDKVTYGVVILKTTPWALDRDLALVPWGAIEVVPPLHAVRIDADAPMLKAVAFTRAEGFPYLGDPLYARGIETRFEATPYWETLGYIPGEGPMAEEMKPSRSDRDLDVSVWRPDSEYNRCFDPGLVTTVRGTIRSIGVFRPGRNAVEGLSLSVKTREGPTWVIHAGPRPFMESQDISLHFGDEVTVMGAPARIAAWSGEVLMASTIQSGDVTCRLRDANGAPQWDVDNLARPASER